MGGQNEKVIPPASTTNQTGAKISIGTNLRIHEKRQEGNVHFHDDAAGLKVAIKTPEFFKRWGEFKSSPNVPLVMVDAEAKTKLTIKSVESQGKLDIAGEISQMEFGDAFKALDAFSQGK